VHGHLINGVTLELDGAVVEAPRINVGTGEEPKHNVRHERVEAHSFKGVYQTCIEAKGIQLPAAYNREITLLVTTANVQHVSVNLSLPECSEVIIKTHYSQRTGKKINSQDL
jgi:hypothetical protein